MATPKLRFKEFDGDWSIKSISEVSNLTSSKRVHLVDYVSEGIPFFRGKEITELKSGIFPSDILYISHDQFNEFKEKYGVPRNNEILITAVGTLANTYLINTNYDFYFKDGNLIWLKDINTDPKFLMILLDAKKKDVLASSIGSTQKALTIANLNKLTFSFPCNIEQTKIATFLFAVDDKIQQLTKKHELLSQYKQGMMQKLFSQQIRFKADDGSEFKAWETLELGSISDVTKLAGYEFTKHIVYKEQGSIIALRGLNIKNNKLDLKDVKYIDESNLNMLTRSKLFIDDLLFTYVGTIGEVALIKENDKFYLAPNVSRIRVSSVFLSPKYLLHYFNNSNFKKNEIDKYIATSSQPALSMANIRKFKIATPCLEEQTKIADFLSAIDQKIEGVSQQLEQAKTWKKGLLQQMFV